MPKNRPLQSSFTSGVVNPALKARLDIDHYYEGLLLGDNIDIKPQGGIMVRAGTRYRATALALNARLIPFVFNRDDKYLLEFTALKMRVFKAGVLQTNLNGSGNDYITTTLTAAQVADIDFTQSYNSMFLFHEDVQPQLLFRGGDDTTWTIGAVTFDNIPEFDFNDSDSPTPTTHDVDIEFQGSWASGDHYKLELNNYETPEIVYSSTTAANIRRIEEELLKLPPTGFRSSSITVTYVSGTTYQIQFSDDSAEPYEPITGFSLDTAASKIAQTAVNATGVARREACISATRGWPRCGALYEGRLWMAGLKSLPQHELGSVVNDFLNLNIGEGFDDEAIFQAFDTDQFNGVDFLHPGRHLQAFTEGGEFFHPARPITPGASGRPRQTRYGSGGIKPTEIDGAALFITRSGKTLREFLFAQLEEAYNANSLSLLAADPLLSAGVVSMDSISGASEDESSYVRCVTADGNMAVLNTLRSQDIAGWSRYTTDGDYKQVAVVDDIVYCLVHRTIGGVETAFIEEFDDTLRMDSAIEGTQASSTTISGLDHLEGETVRVIADGYLVDSETVASGAITVDVACTAYQVGLDYNPDVNTLPLTTELGDGPIIGRTKSVPDLYVLVKDTAGLIASFNTTDEDGVEIVQEQSDPSWVVGVNQTDIIAGTVSGSRHFEFLGSTENDAIIGLKQRDPLPFHILGLVATVDIGGE